MLETANTIHWVMIQEDNRPVPVLFSIYDHKLM